MVVLLACQCYLLRRATRRSPSGPAEAFTLLDNGDGLISKEELSAHIEKVGGSTALVEKLLSTLDEDGDGQIIRAEFKALAI